jgi:hypothetical protein
MEVDIKNFINKTVLINKYVYFKEFEYSDIACKLDLLAQKVKEHSKIFKFIPILMRFDGDGDLTLVGYYYENPEKSVVMYIKENSVEHYGLRSLLNLPDFDTHFIDYKEQCKKWNEQSYFPEIKIDEKKIQNNILMYLEQLLTKVSF